MVSHAHRLSSSSLTMHTHPHTLRRPQCAHHPPPCTLTHVRARTLTLAHAISPRTPAARTSSLPTRSPVFMQARTHLCMQGVRGFVGGLGHIGKSIRRALLLWGSADFFCSYCSRYCVNSTVLRVRACARLASVLFPESSRDFLTHYGVCVGLFEPSTALGMHVHTSDASVGLSSLFGSPHAVLLL